MRRGSGDVVGAVVRRVFAALAVVTLAASVGCSGSDQVEPAAPSQTVSPAITHSSDSESVEGDTDASPGIAGADFAQIVTLEAGEQVADVHGDTVSVYGYAPWPSAFAQLPGATRASFPFADDLGDLAASEIVALDVGLCAAGITQNSFGTVEFFAQSGADAPIPEDDGVGREVPVRHPAISPGFVLPDQATCTRGWLPVRVALGEEPDVARYLLTTRADAQAEPERHLYQWSIAPTAPAAAPDAFAVGQTVTYQGGPLVGTSIQVDGWAELVGEPSPLDGTRLVAVSLQVCPAGDPEQGSDAWPSLGLTLDLWNLAAPLDSTEFFSNADADGCFDGWVDFVVPLGAIPTGFFASDRIDPIAGYAEWSLVGAALAAPE